METRKLTAQNSLRTGTAILVLALWSMISPVESCRRTHILAKNPVDALTMYERRFVEIKKRLPDTGTVGYVGDEIGDEGTRAYYRTQYSLSPVVVDRTTGHELVIGNFREDVHTRIVPAALGLTLLQDFGGGVMLFKNDAWLQEARRARPETNADASGK